MTSAIQENRVDKFPLWATLIIALVVATYIFVYVAGIMTIRATQRIARELVDPRNIATVANTIGGMPEQPPAGFSYRVGLSVNDEKIKQWFGLPASAERIKDLALMSLNFLAIEHVPDGQQIVLVSSPQDGSKDPKEILQAAYDIGINTGKTTARFRSITKRGQTQVAGLPMPYLMGETEDATQQKMQGMIGCIDLKNQHRNILVYGLQPEGDSYNLSETLGLLNCVHF